VEDLPWRTLCTAWVGRGRGTWCTVSSWTWRRRRAGWRDLGRWTAYAASCRRPSRPRCTPRTLGRRRHRQSCNSPRATIIRHSFVHLFTARRYASAVYAVVLLCPSVRPSVRHKPVLYRNVWTNRAGFWHGGFLPRIPHCGNLGISENRPKGTSLWNFCHEVWNFDTASRRVVNKTRRRSSLFLIVISYCDIGCRYSATIQELIDWKRDL